MKNLKIDYKILTIKEDENNDKSWYVNSNVTKHVYETPHILCDIMKTHNASSVRIVGGVSHTMIGKGYVWFKTQNGSIKKIINVLYVHGIIKNLLFVGVINNKSYLSIFGSKKCLIIENPNPNVIVAKGVKVNSINGLWKIELNVNKSSSCALVNTIKIISQTRLWHRCLGQ